MWCCPAMGHAPSCLSCHRSCSSQQGDEQAVAGYHAVALQVLESFRLEKTCKIIDSNLCTVTLQPPVPLCQSPSFPQKILEKYQVTPFLKVHKSGSFDLEWETGEQIPVKMIRLKELLLLTFVVCLDVCILYFLFSPYVNCPLDVLSIWLVYKTMSTIDYPSRSWQRCLNLGRILGNFSVLEPQTLKCTLVWTLEGSSVHVMAAAFCIPE